MVLVGTELFVFSFFRLNKAAILRTPFMALSINPTNRCTFSGFKTLSVFSIASTNASLDDSILFVSSNRRFVISVLSSSVSFRYGFLGFEGLSFSVFSGHSQFKDFGSNFCHSFRWKIFSDIFPFIYVYFRHRY